MRILLIAPHFSPDEHIGASRWNRLSKYLMKDGHEVYVIASDIISTSTASERATQLFRVNYQASFVDKMLMKFGKAKKNLSVEKTRQSANIPKQNIKARLYNYLVNFAGKIARFPGVYWWSASESVRIGTDLVRTKGIEIIIATHPFSVSLRAAKKISSKTKVPWIADLRDGWSSYYFGEYNKGSVFYAALKMMERYYLGKAARVVTINNILATSLNVDKSKVVIIPNVFDPEEQLPDITASGNNHSVLFAFAGSVHENHCWDILFDAINLSEKGITESIQINYYGGYYDRLNAKRLRYAIPDAVLVNHGYLERAELRDELSKADILLVFGFQGAFGDSVTTGKIFDYIETGKTVLVFGPSTSELAQLVTKTGIGLVISDSASARNVLMDIVRDKASFISRLAEQRNQQEIDFYSASKMAEKYVKLIKDL